MPTPLSRKNHPSLLLVLAVFAGTLAFGWSGSATADTEPAPQPVESELAGEPFVPGEVIVQYEDEEVPQTIDVADRANIEVVADILEDRPDIEYASPNYIASISRWMPDDPGVNRSAAGRVGGWRDKQWNLLPCLSSCRSGASIDEQSPGGINAVRAWHHLRKAGRPGAAGVKVAVLDTGVAYRKLNQGFRRNPDLSPRNFVPGYDFVDDDRLPLDRNGHGTHVTSTISQATDNGRGLAGIAYRAKIMPVRVMDTFGFGTTENIVRGIRWAANRGARVISMSINFDCGLEVPPVEAALDYAHRKGAVLVGSSGNRGQVSCPSLPATAPPVINVGGTTESGCVANYSFRSEEIDIAAPGGGVGSDGCVSGTANRPILQVAMIGSDPTWFGIEKGWKGTSMAAAHVAGAAAMVIASDVLEGGKKGPRQIRERILGTARLPEFASGDPASGAGAGILDLGRATNPKVK